MKYLSKNVSGESKIDWEANFSKTLSSNFHNYNQNLEKRRCYRNIVVSVVLFPCQILYVFIFKV